MVIAWLSVFKEEVGREQSPGEDVVATNKCASYGYKLKPEIIDPPVGMFDYAAYCAPFWLLS